MAIFSRRTIQRLINENASSVSRRQIKTHVEKLNKGDISAEWEVVLLNVFSKLGKVEHERNFNGRNPDLYFTSEDHALEFLADIKTVSDEGIELKNPQRQLNDRLHEEVKKWDIKGAWYCQIGGDREEARRTGRMIQLKLPPLARFDQEIFNKRWEEFVAQIKREPDKVRRYEIKTDRIDLAITYRPSKGWTGTGSFPSYKSMTAREHLIQNSVWNGLVAKSAQLESTGYDGMLGIILCDGGSEFLKKSGSIINEFFRAHPRINFVLAFEAIQNFGLDSSNYVAFYYSIGQGVSDELRKFITNFPDDIFPYPVKSAANAVNALKSTKAHIGGSFYGGCEMSENTIKLSSRVVLDLLAGRITYDDFPEAYKAFFKVARDEGRLFEAAKIEKDDKEKDDDWLIFKFGKPDPAVTPYTVPKEMKP